MSLEDLRREIDEADRSLLEAIEKRMAISRRIGEYKKNNGQTILDTSREASKIESLSAQAGDESREYIKDLYETIFKVSRAHQAKKLFGVLGKKLPHTYSPAIHHMIAPQYLYSVIERDEDELDELFAKKVYGGFNVTIPYKREAAARSDVLSAEAAATGAVNTVVFGDDGKTYGYNTDIFGFEYMLESAGISPEGKVCLVLGHGGAASAVEYALKEMGAAKIVFCSRREEINFENVYEKVPDAQVIVNCTPLGMYPETDVSPVDLSKFKAAEAAADLIYNPSRTLFLQQADRLGLKTAGGLTMLVAQACKAAGYFLGDESSVKDMDIEGTTAKLQRSMKNITIIGMPGCGKSVLAKKIAQVTGRELIDLDIWYAEEYGQKPSETIESFGEDVFRTNETALAAKILPMSGRIISCGGGIVTREENLKYLRMNSVVIWLKRPLDVLASDDRPLSKKEGVQKLYEQRKDNYASWSDITLEIGAKDSREEFLSEAIDKLTKEGLL